jgi:hypothetical protein
LRKGNDRINTPAALQRLGLVFVAKGDLHRGRTLLEEGLELARASGNRRHVASGLAGLGALSTSEGAYADAQTFHAEALRIRAASGMRPAIADSLERLGRLSVAAGRGERAAVLLGSAEELRETVGTVIDPVDKPEHDEALAKVKADLSKAAFDAAWAKGRALSVDEAVAYALDESSG